MDDFLRYGEKCGAVFREAWRYQTTLGNQPEPFEVPGICDHCACQTNYKVKPVPAGTGFEVKWWGSVPCGCGLSNLERCVLRVLDDAPAESIYHVGHYSKFRRILSERVKGVVSSQFDDARQPGEIVNGVRYEDLTRLTYADGEFSTLIATEVLEHIPDYKLALREMARVLRPGGRALLTFPWLGKDRYDHLKRATMDAEGSITHILPPEYHGDPANKNGILSFRSFGWQILDEMRENGFSEATAEYIFAPVHGYNTLICPVIVGTR